MNRQLQTKARDARRSERLAAAQELAGEPGMEAAAELRRLAFQDPSAEVRHAARRALEEHRQKHAQVARTPVEIECAGDFRRALASPEPAERLAAVGWLARERFASGLAEVVNTVESEPDSETRAAMATAIGRLGGPSELSVLARLTCDADARVRANALEALVYLEPAQVYAAAALALQDPDHRVKANAALLLASAGLEDALRVLGRMLATGRAHYEDAAAFALSKLPPSQPVLKLLVHAARLKNGPAREKAVAALQRHAAAGVAEARQSLDLLGASLAPADETAPGAQAQPGRGPTRSALTAASLVAILEKGDAWQRKEAAR